MARSFIVRAWMKTQRWKSGIWRLMLQAADAAVVTLSIFIFIYSLFPRRTWNYFLSPPRPQSLFVLFSGLAHAHISYKKLRLLPSSFFFPFQDSLFVFHCEVRALLNWISSSLSCFKNFSFICRWRCNCTKNNTDCCSAHAWALPHLAKTIQSIGNSLIVTIFWFYGNSILHNGPVFPSQ